MEAGRVGGWRAEESTCRCSASRWSGVASLGNTTKKSKPFLGGKNQKDAGASRWSAVTFFGDTTKLVLDLGGLLMEAPHVRDEKNSAADHCCARLGNIVQA